MSIQINEETIRRGKRRLLIRSLLYAVTVSLIYAGLFVMLYFAIADGNAVKTAEGIPYLNYVIAMVAILLLPSAVQLPERARQVNPSELKDEVKKLQMGMTLSREQVLEVSVMSWFFLGAIVLAIPLFLMPLLYWLSAGNPAQFDDFGPDQYGTSGRLLFAFVVNQSLKGR